MNTAMAIFLIIIVIAGLLGLVFILSDRSKKALSQENKELKSELTLSEEKASTYQAALVEIAQGSDVSETIAREALYSRLPGLNKKETR